MAMSVQARGYSRVNSKDDAYAVDREKHIKGALNRTSLESTNDYNSTRANGLETAETSSDTTSSRETDEVHLFSTSKTLIDCHVRRPSIRLATGTFEYHAADNKGDLASSKRSVEAVTMDFLPAMTGCSGSDTSKGDGDGSATNIQRPTAALHEESRTEPGKAGNEESDINETALDDTKGKGRHNASSLCMLIAVLVGSVCLVALIIALAITSVKLLEARQKRINIIPGIIDKVPGL
jgi:hypothetical protein